MAEQPDKKEVIKIIAYLLQRLSKLYQIPNWSEENSVLLSEWVYDNYKWDSLEDVITCLRNPPEVDENNWRLTPDFIKLWMEKQLEKTAIKRETEHQELKMANKEPLADIDYESFKMRINDFLQKPKETNFKENEIAKKKLDNPYKYYDVRGIKVYATSQKHAEELIQLMIKRGDIIEEGDL